MIPAGHPTVQLSSRTSATYHVLLTKLPVYAIELAKTSYTKTVFDLIWMKILNSDSQCGF